LYFYPNSSTEKPVTIFPSLCENFLGFRKNSFLSQFDLLLSYSIFNVLAAGCRTHTRGGMLPLPYSRTGYSAFSVVRARVRRLRFPLALRLNGRLPLPYFLQHFCCSA